MLLAVRPPEEEARPRLPSDAEVLAQAAAEALSESAALFAGIRDALQSKKRPNAATLQQWKKQIKTVNKAVSKTTRLSWKQLDRKAIEAATACVEAHKDSLDERANCARVVEKLRTFSNVTDGSVDRAVASTATVQNLMATLCAAPETTFHGAHALHEDVQTNADNLDGVFGS